MTLIIIAVLYAVVAQLVWFWLSPGQFASAVSETQLLIICLMWLPLFIALIIFDVFLTVWTFITRENSADYYDEP